MAVDPYGPPLLPWDMPDEEVERIQRQALHGLLLASIDRESMHVEQAHNYRNDSVVFTITTRVEVTSRMLERAVPQQDRPTLAQMEERIGGLLRPTCDGSSITRCPTCDSDSPAHTDGVYRHRYGRDCPDAFHEGADL